MFISFSNGDATTHLGAPFQLKRAKRNRLAFDKAGDNLWQPTAARGYSIGRSVRSEHCFKCAASFIHVGKIMLA
jgi:hypothetical protein